VIRRFASLTRERTGATALEFGLVAALFLPLCLAIIGGGLLMWTKGALQSTASLTARCAAIEAPHCSNIANFAVATAAGWVFPGIIAPDDVQHSIVCRSTVPFMKVTITSHFWSRGVLATPLSGVTLSAVAFFPMGAPVCS
jgi:Flp pilus assembly pilin Flp